MADVASADVEGVNICSDAASCAVGCEVVITMLPNGTILQAVANQIRQVMTSGSVLLDCSTVDVDTAKSVATQMADAGIDMLDAPFPAALPVRQLVR